MLTFVFIIGTQFAFATPDCLAPAPMAAGTVTPESVAKFLRENPKVDDPGKLVCCLPEQMRDSFVIMHNSDAGQSGNPHGPRILMYERPLDTTDFSLKTVASMNGGGADLNNPNNFEMMHKDASSGELDFFDIEGAGDRTRVTKNPQECLNCHGTGGRKTSIGLHPNFQPSGKWTRTAGGVQPCPGPETEYLKAVHAVTERSLLSNPRYKCLPRERIKQAMKIVTGGTFQSGAGDLDFRLDRLNNERTARLLRDTPAYDAYRFVILGALVCDDPKTEDLPWDKWIPPDALRRHNNVSHLSPVVAKSSDLLGTLRAGRQTRANEQRRLTGLLAADAQKILAGGDPEFHLPQQRVTCGAGGGDVDGLDPYREPKLSGNKNYDRFIVDGLIRANSGLQPGIRYLIEGRGIGLEDIDMDAAGGEYGRRIFTPDLADKLVKLERADSPVTTLLGGKSLADLARDEKAKKIFCAALRTKSMGAFAARPRIASGSTSATSAR